MAKYKLIQTYPGWDKLGTIIDGDTTKIGQMVKVGYSLREPHPLDFPEHSKSQYTSVFSTFKADFEMWTTKKKSGDL